MTYTAPPDTRVGHIHRLDHCDHAFAHFRIGRAEHRVIGVAPPDLSLIARSRGTDYIYSFLRGFYADESTPSGANNVVLANTACGFSYQGDVISAAFRESDPPQ